MKPEREAELAGKQLLDDYRRLQGVEFVHKGCAGLRERDNAELIRQRDEALAEVARLAAQVAAVRALIPPSWYEVPPDGTVLIATYSGGYGREDLPDRERAWVRSDQDTPPKDPDGDWYQVGDPDDYRASYSEVLAHDDPECDRPTVTAEVLVSVYSIARALDSIP